jgi:hypothetical protein
MQESHKGLTGEYKSEIKDSQLNSNEDQVLNQPLAQ